jgi:hypothetical protein
MKKKILVTCIILLFILIGTFAKLDKLNYLYFGWSLDFGQYKNELPFTTKVFNDKDLVGTGFTYYYNLAGDEDCGGYSLDVQDTFEDLKGTDCWPTLITDTIQDKDTLVYFYDVEEYRYNDNYLLIRARDKYDNHYWISPTLMDTISQPYNEHCTNVWIRPSTFSAAERERIGRLKRVTISEFAAYIFLAWCIVPIIIIIDLIVIIIFAILVICSRKSKKTP